MPQRIGYDPSGGAESAGMLSLRIGGYQSVRSVHSRALQIFADTLAESLGSAIDIRITANIMALDHRADALLTMSEGDQLDLCYFPSSDLAARVPSLQLFDRPFRFSGRAPAYALMDGGTGRRIADDVAEQTGFRVLGFWDNGFRHLSNNCQPIRHPDDCLGLRIRTANNAVHQAFFRRLGFEPVSLDVKDMLEAAANGSIDAQESALTDIVTFGVQRYHRFLSLTGHLFSVMLLLVNRARYDTWPAEIRNAIGAAAVRATTAQRRDAQAEEESCLARLIGDGVHLVPEDEFDRAAFEQLARAKA